MNIETLARKIKQSVNDILEENLVEANNGICTTDIYKQLSKIKEEYKELYNNYMFSRKLSRKTAERNLQLMNILSECLPFLDTASQQEPEAEKLIKEIYNQVFNK